MQASQASTTRRALFGAGLAVAAISAPTITVAAPAAHDAELGRLFTALENVQDQVERADRVWMKAEARRAKLEGETPEVLRKVGADWAAGLPIGDSRASNFHDDLDAAIKARDGNAAVFAQVGCNKRAMERCAEVVDAIIAWEAHKEAAYEKSGTGPAYNALEELQWAEEKAAAAIQAYHPRTLAGLKRKAEYVKDRLNPSGEINEWQAAWARSLVEDAIKLGAV